MMVIEYLVKNMAILHCGGNYQYVNELSVALEKLVHPIIGCWLRIRICHPQP